MGGRAERQLRAIFEAAKMKAPSLIVIDELDAMVPARDRVQGEVEARRCNAPYANGRHSCSNRMSSSSERRIVLIRSTRHYVVARADLGLKCELGHQT